MKERLQRALGKRSPCGRGCSEPGAAALRGDEPTKGILEHAVTQGPGQTSAGTKTQGRGTAACPGSFQRDGREIREGKGS